jgi:hypothetical protein
MSENSIRATPDFEHRRRRAILIWVAVIAVVAASVLYFLSHRNNYGSSCGGVVSGAAEDGSVRQSNGNASNMSFVVSDGDAVFYTDFARGGLKTRRINTPPVELDDLSAYYVGFSGHYVCYYVPSGSGISIYGEIKRVRPDGINRDVVTEAPGVLSSMYTTEEDIFFSVTEPEGAAGVYRVPVSGGAITKLADGSSDMINVDVDGDSIYFRHTDAASGEASIMRVDADGSSAPASVLADATDVAAAFYVADAGEIYFTDTERKLHRVDETGKVNAVTGLPDDINAINIADGYIYLGVTERDGDADAFSESIYRYPVVSMRYKDRDGNDAIVRGLIPGSPIGIAGGKVYFFEPGETDGAIVLCSMNPDGTDRKAL